MEVFTQQLAQRDVAYRILDNLTPEEIDRYCPFIPNLQPYCRDSAYWQRRIEWQLKLPSRPTDDRVTFDHLEYCFREEARLIDCLNFPNDRIIEPLVDRVVNNDLKHLAWRALYAIGLLNRLDLLGKLSTKFGYVPGPRGEERLIMGAAEGNHRDLVLWLIDQGASIEDAIQGAARGDRRELLAELMRRNAINQGVDEGIIFEDLGHALLGAAGGGQLDLVRGLVDMGTYNLNEALMIAEDERHSNVVDYLISQGADFID